MAERTIVLAGEDGEVEKFTVVEERGGKKGTARISRYSSPYVVLFLTHLSAIARDRELTGTDLRVLLVVLARASHEHPDFDTDPGGIAAELGVHEQEVYRALRILAAKDLIRRPKKGKLALNPAIAWRGSADARERALPKPNRG